MSYELYNRLWYQQIRSFILMLVAMSVFWFPIIICICLFAFSHHHHHNKSICHQHHNQLHNHVHNQLHNQLHSRLHNHNSHSAHNKATSTNYVVNANGLSLELYEHKHQKSNDSKYWLFLYIHKSRQIYFLIYTKYSTKIFCFGQKIKTIHLKKK